MTVTPVYAGILALLFVLLSVRVIGSRVSVRVAVGDGGDKTLLRRIRVHANFAEYIPMALILMALAEMQGAAKWPLHLIGVLLVAGRLSHAYGVGREPENLRFRQVGMALTFTALISGALLNLGVSILR